MLLLNWPGNTTVGCRLQYMFWKLCKRRLEVLGNLLAKMYLAWRNVLICKIPGWEGEYIAEVRLQPPARRISQQALRLIDACRSRRIEAVVPTLYKDGSVDLDLCSTQSCHFDPMATVTPIFQSGYLSQSGIMRCSVQLHSLSIIYCPTDVYCFLLSAPSFCIPSHPTRFPAACSTLPSP